MPTKFKVTFELEEQDAAYFRGLYRAAKKSAAKMDADTIIKDATKLVEHLVSGNATCFFTLRARGVLSLLSADVKNFFRSHSVSQKAPLPAKLWPFAGVRASGTAHLLFEAAAWACDSKS